MFKVQNDLFNGETLYHNRIVKTEEEIAEMKRAREEKKRLKDLRKKIQNENIEKKEQRKAEHKQKSMHGNEQQQQQQNNDDDEDHVVDDDADYYRKEVGEEPDEGRKIKKKTFLYLFSMKRNNF